MAILQDLIVSVRNLRAELKVGQKDKVPVQVYAEDEAVREMISQNLGRGAAAGACVRHIVR